MDGKLVKSIAWWGSKLILFYPSNFSKEAAKCRKPRPLLYLSWHLDFVSPTTHI